MMLFTNSYQLQKHSQSFNHVVICIKNELNYFSNIYKIIEILSIFTIPKHLIRKKYPFPLEENGIFRV